MIVLNSSDDPESAAEFALSNLAQELETQSEMPE